MTALDNRRQSYIGTLKKDKGDIFLECCAERFKVNFLRYVNEVLFEMVKKYLKDTYLGGTTPTELQNKVSKCRKMYYHRETRFMFNQSVNGFNTRFLFKIDALPQNFAFLLDIAATFFKNLSPNVREFWI